MWKSESRVTGVDFMATVELLKANYYVDPLVRNNTCYTVHDEHTSDFYIEMAGSFPIAGRFFLFRSHWQMPSPDKFFCIHLHLNSGFKPLSKDLVQAETSKLI